MTVDESPKSTPIRAGKRSFKRSALLGAATAFLVLGVLVRPAFAPPWPRCVPCQITKGNQLFGGYFSAAELSPSQSVHYISLWTDTQGVTPVIAANMPGTQTYLGVYDQYLTRPFNSAMVSFYTCHVDVYSKTICGWTTWQSVTAY
jgi:hypothetical protein